MSRDSNMADTNMPDTNMPDANLADANLADANMADAPNFDLFDEEDWRRQDELDNHNMAKLFNVPETAQEEDPDKKLAGALFDLNRPLDLGEKADDAEDYEDISDDDLPDEEEPTGEKDDDAPGLTDDMGMEDDDDLFGDNRPSSPVEGPQDSQGFYPDQELNVPHTNGEVALAPAEPIEDLMAINFPALRVDPNAPKYDDEFIKTLWPTFERGTLLYLNTGLMPQRKTEWVPKIPVKLPRPLNPTKVSLDIAPDTEKSFRTAGPSSGDKRKRIQEAEAKGLIAIEDESSDEEDDEDVFDYCYPTDTVGGNTLIDLEVVCADWDSIINRTAEETPPEPEDEPMDEWEKEFLGPSSKRKKPVEEKDDFVNAPQFPCPSFDNFEEMVSQTAKRVVLDLNDPTLLVDMQEANPAAKRRRLGAGGEVKRVSNGSFMSRLTQRFNLSNDEAYDALKENHQSRVRATIGNYPVEHSLPALKLQWPYYQVKMLLHQARSFHRPNLRLMKTVGHTITFSKPGLRKRKNMKGLPTHEVFKHTEDLSLSEFYSSATLFEYSEEHPIVLSNFGMGNRVINYYRVKNAEDKEGKPQFDDKVGDAKTLLPEDKSPFSNFGMINPGETVRAIHNDMFRAPIFKHEPKQTDFLIVRTTNSSGFHWYIRNIDNLFVVGQQFPNTEIPGPHSRKVTNAAKNRMKMIGYRMIRRDPIKVVRIDELTKHIPDSTEQQNRQKLKEFLKYDKDHRYWQPLEGGIPDPLTVRNMIKPEDVCVLDAMQVGCRYLLDAGYEIKEAKEGAPDDDDEDQGLEYKLAPWRTSKAFIEASNEKAMLQLHGAGDPTGRGLGYSFIKTSMKGGYLQGNKDAAVKQSIEGKPKGGHTYNVKEQQVLYNAAIKLIWDKQKANLSDDVEHEEDPIENDDNEENRLGVPPTPQYGATPAAMDDMASTISRQNRVMQIKRKVRNHLGQEIEEVEVITDPRVWRMYEKRCREIKAKNTDVEQIKFTGDTEADRVEFLRVQGELSRLNRNKDRRIAREKQKANQGKSRGRKAATIEPDNAGSPSSTPTQSIEGSKPTGTTRKCANCGQTGHIKTNKKLCPMLNGTMKQEDLATNSGGFGTVVPPSFS